MRRNHRPKGRDSRAAGRRSASRLRRRRRSPQGTPPEPAGQARIAVAAGPPKVGSLEREQLREAAKTSNAALAKLGTDIQWVESYVADDKTFCIYLARDEAIIRRHAEVSGFPASRITEVATMIDPTTAAG